MFLLLITSKIETRTLVFALLDYHVLSNLGVGVGVQHKQLTRTSVLTWLGATDHGYFCVGKLSIYLDVTLLVTQCLITFNNRWLYQLLMPICDLTRSRGPAKDRTEVAEKRATRFVITRRRASTIWRFSVFFGSAFYYESKVVTHLQKQRLGSWCLVEKRTEIYWYMYVYKERMLWNTNCK